MATGLEQTEQVGHYKITVFPGYHRPAGPRWRNLGLLALLFGFGLAFGAAIAWLPTERLSLLVIPVAVLAALTVWVLPEGTEPPTRLMTWMFTAYFVALTLWPYYLAISLPGFPLIEIRRVFVALAILAMMVSLSISRSFRQRMKEIIGASPWIFRLFGTFVVIQMLSLPLARSFPAATSAFVRDQLGWTAVLFMSSYVFTRPGEIGKWAAILRGMAIVMVFMGIAEYHNKAILWANHIPSFLQVGDPGVQRILSPVFRSNVYRINGTFPVSLSLAEWLALTMPFFLYYIFFGRRMAIRIFCVIGDALVFLAIILTQARIGLIGTLVAHSVFVAVWAMRARRLQRGSVLPTIALAAYPVLLVSLIGAVMTVPALRVRVLGGGAQAASTQGRIEQFHMAVPMIMRRPVLGYGVGQAPLQLGWADPSGQISIDSYILTLLLDYGVPGFAVYVSLMGVAITQGFRLSMKGDEDSENGYAGAAAICLCIWLACQNALSQEDNASFIFMIVGMIAAISWRDRHPRPAPATPAQIES
ncbi:putative diutan polysaccharide polymerase [Novosphingobium nitrogenifigens DSM 19370]|uniref:Putative diutan polysaccharide polymerase n=1 Tax=Novosphingobium nitrogenifigens DSM 19370 TaxID=983920 RepID=F1Z532_9SPHN|nr:O-antigen ligase family protein [Novosphingobium nitrogenifigens]EGD59997.1 putative diutan polysaccharide polymerase [Novosphingobium nitrogenifigens DSM 19370]